MRKLLAIFAVVIILIFAFIFSPFLATNPVLFPDLPILWLLTGFFLLVIIISFISLYRTILYRPVERIILNFVIAITILTYLFPIFFNVLNVSIFSTQYQHAGEVDSALIKDKMLCGEPITGNVPYAKEQGHDIRILCPIANTTASLFYTTRVIPGGDLIIEDLPKVLKFPNKEKKPNVL